METETVMVSPRYEIVIPRAIRESLSIHPGQKIQLVRYQNHIELIPVRSARELRGFLKGIDTTIEEERNQA